MRALRPLVLAFALAPAALAAQYAPSTGTPGPEIDAPPAPYSDPSAALAWIRHRLAVEPGRPDLHLAAARELTALGVTDTAHAPRLSSLKQAEAEARAAIALDSTSAEAHYWLAAALGLEADEQGGLAKISAARGAYAETLATLRLDPQHPGARHILGRLHAGTLRLSRLNRLIARGLGLGEILGQASWSSAEENLRFAAEHDPERWVHPLELAKLLVRRDRAAEGAAILRDLAGRAPRHALDRHYQAEARALLARMG